MLGLPFYTSILTPLSRFGSAVEDLTYKTRYRVYYSEQVSNGARDKQRT
jgi:hypothetical protein